MSMLPRMSEKLKAHGIVVSISVEPVPFGKGFDFQATLGGVRLWCRENLKGEHDVLVDRVGAWNTQVAYMNIFCMNKEDADHARKFWC